MEERRMDKPIGPRTAGLLGMLAGLAPETPARKELAGHQCPECRRSIGHSDACCTSALERFSMHCRDHPPCRKALKGMAGVEAFDGTGLCERGRRLFDKATALGEARDAEYEKTTGGRPGDKRPV
jgi:hypothetical protein